MEINSNKKNFKSKTYSFANNNNLHKINNNSINDMKTNFKSSKFLDKFKNQISVTGNEGVAVILSNTNKINFAQPGLKDKPSTLKHLQQWKEVYNERIT